jgi:hypothetical protein
MNYTKVKYMWKWGIIQIFSFGFILKKRQGDERFKLQVPTLSLKTTTGGNFNTILISMETILKLMHGRELILIIFFGSQPKEKRGREFLSLQELYTFRIFSHGYMLKNILKVFRIPHATEIVQSLLSAQK